jgi:hypothetical protein
MDEWLELTQHEQWILKNCSRGCVSKHYSRCL